MSAGCLNSTSGTKFTLKQTEGSPRRKRKPEVFTALGDDVVTRINIIVT